MSEQPTIFEPVEQRLKADDEFTDEDIEELRSFFFRHYDEFETPVSDIRLDSIAVENFKVISRRKVAFDRQNTVLYGRNSKGKTSIVRAILFNIAGQPPNSEFGMTKLIQKDKDTLSTTGEWTIDDTPYTLERSLRKSGRGGGLSGADEPYLSDGHDTDNQLSISNNFTDPSRVLAEFGLLELNTRHHNPFEVLALFFLMAEDFTRFLGRGHSDLIDLLFRINITSVVTAAENQIEELTLSETENQSAQQLTKYRNEREQLEARLTKLENYQETVLNDLKAKQGRLESLNDALAGESELDQLRQRRSALRSQEADLKVERSETIDKLARVRRLIERHEDTELREDLDTIADELRNFMSVPDRCPVCTNSVDAEQRERLLHEEQCPLCAKEMPSERVRVEKEHLERESVTDEPPVDTQNHVDDLRAREDKLVSTKQQLEQRLESVSSELNQVNERIANNDTTDLVDEQEALERDVRTLRDEAVDLEVEVDTLETELVTVERHISANEHLKSIAKEKDRRRTMYRRFKTFVVQARAKERRELKNNLESEMEALFAHFNAGTLATAQSVSIQSGDSYHFEIITEETTLDSSIPDESNAEINLHALLFHTAVLKHMSKEGVSLPLRLFVIDSPFANEVDKRNERDISQFLSALPDILSGHQIIIASAETEAFDPSDYSNHFQLKEFS